MRSTLDERSIVIYFLFNSYLKRIDINFACFIRTNKFVGTFFSTGILGGGQESTTLSMIPFFAHMGMTYVSLGYLI
jgi:multimeric flavodoxin WrbA